MILCDPGQIKQVIIAFMIGHHGVAMVMESGIHAGKALEVTLPAAS